MSHFNHQDWIFWLAPLILVILLMVWQQNFTAAIVLTSCLTITTSLFWLVFNSNPLPISDNLWMRLARMFLKGTPTEEIAELEESAKDIIEKFKGCIQEASESLKILLALRKRLHKNPSLAKEASESHLHRYALLSLTDVDPSDVRIPAAIDVINEVLNVANAKKIILDDELEAREFADSLMRITIGLMERSVATGDTTSGDGDRKLGTSFSTYGYKFLMAIGLLSMDSDAMKSRLGDKGGIAFAVNCLKGYANDHNICKWGCWVLIQLIEAHPPNKREFVTHAGIPLVISSFKRHADKVEVHQQGFVLLVYVLMNDPKTKMSLTGARQMALTHGIVEVIHKAQRRFVDAPDIQATSAKILDILISDWS